MATQPKRLRADDVPNIPVTDPDCTGYELVDGELVPVIPAKRTHSGLAVEVVFRLRSFLQTAGIGRAFYDVWCRLPLPHDVERLRAPDVAYFSTDKLEAAGNAEIFHVPPDLVIEIFSPTNQRRRGDFQQRVRDYLDAGVRLLWVIYPDAGYAMVHRADGSARMVRETQALDGEDVLPGFRLELGELLRAGEP
jgi:Uma2 family endonuclease